MDPQVSTIALAVLGLLMMGFCLFVLSFSNPFERVFPAPLEGRDLNPMLQDVGLIFHPPLLYLGYVGFAVNFALAVAALVSGKMDAAVAYWSRLGAGGVGVPDRRHYSRIWWAYYELGWGAGGSGIRLKTPR